MVALALALALAAAPLTPPLERGVARNGAPVIAVPSSSPSTVAVLELARPDGVGQDVVEAVLPTMAAAARAAAGKDGIVEVTWRPASVAVIVTTPTTGTDGALRAIDAALKALRGPPPKTPAPLPTPWRGDRAYQGVASADVVAAWKAMAGIGPAHIAVAVIGPGPGPDLLRRAEALVAAPLKKDAVRTRRDLGPRSDDKAAHVTVPAATAADVAALEIAADLVGAHVHDGDGSVSVGLYGPPDQRRTQLSALRDVPPPQALVDDTARIRRLARAAPIDDPAALALTLTKDTLEARDTFAVIDALAVVERDAVTAAAGRLLEVLP